MPASDHLDFRRGSTFYLELFRCFHGLRAYQQPKSNENMHIHSLTARRRLPGRFTIHMRRRFMHPRPVFSNLWFRTLRVNENSG
jgi:hypothetical protein